jgi:DNA-binding NarL/FixJ family response regulator
MLVGMPAMQGDIIRRALAGQEDVEVVDWVRDRAVPAAAVAAARPDVIIMDLHELELSADYRDAFGLLAATRVVGVGAGGRYGALFELHPQRTELGELSVEGLLRVIRAGASQG